MQVRWWCVAFVAAGLSLARPAAAGTEARPRVLGGEAVSVPSPTVALRTTAGRLVCSGVLVAARVVLTAAHCIVDERAHGIADACAGPSIASCQSTAGIARVVRHPQYDALTFEHDLAVVVLDAELDVTFAAVGESVVTGERLRVEGYGRSEADAHETAGTVRARELLVTAVDATRIVLEEGTCRGDSGGPAYRGAEVIALTSSGPVGCRDFGRSTRVAPYRDWIAATVAPDAPSGCSATPISTTRRALPFLGCALALVALSRRTLRRSDPRERAPAPTPAE